MTLLNVLNQEILSAIVESNFTKGQVALSELGMSPEIARQNASLNPALCADDLTPMRPTRERASG